MNSKIVLLNTSHHFFDDRVFYHQAKSLFEDNYDVTIVSTVEAMEMMKDNIYICSLSLNSFTRKEKQQKIVEQLDTLKPDIIICDTPIAVLSSHIYRKRNKSKIIYDITEWYPSTNILKNTKGLKKWIRFILLALFNLYAGLLSDAFIFGEKHKGKLFRLFYCWKPYVLLPYFPDLNYIDPKPIHDVRQTIRLFCGGNIYPTGGLPQVIQSVSNAAKRKPATNFQLHILCNLSSEKDIFYFKKLTDNLPKNVEIVQKQLLPFSDFCQYITDMDLFFDLRKINFESNYSLPIKLFYYMACGRPVIYSKLKSITTFFSDISFGYLEDPSNTEAIENCIVNHIDNPEMYTKHCQNALALSKEKYNWAKIEPDFVDFIRQISTRS